MKSQEKEEESINEYDISRTERKINMEQPEGCVVPRQERKVCRLVKSLYGLK